MEETSLLGQVFPLPDKRFSPEERMWLGIPSIACTAGGRLYATWCSGGAFEPSVYNYNIVAISDDNGMTWRELFAVTGYIDQKIQLADPQFWTTPGGQLWFCWGRRDHSLPPQHKQHIATIVMNCDNPDAAEPRFSEPRFLCAGFMRNQPVVLKDGRWLIPAYLLSSASLGYFESADQGATIQLRKGAKKLVVAYDDETMLFERKDGTLVLWYRVNIKYGRIAQSLSHDGGRTWSASELTNIPNPQARFHVRRLPSGRLLLINNFNAKERDNMCIWLSEDDGVTWPYQLLLDGRENVSYPDVALAPDGSLYIIHDRSRYGAKEVLCSRIYEEEIIAGKLFRAESYQNNIVSKAPPLPASGKEVLKHYNDIDEAFFAYRQQLQKEGEVLLEP